MSKDTVTKIIKSCIVSRKGGVPLREIENEYKDLVGQNIPYVALGYSNLRDFIHSIDFVDVKTNYLGDSVLFVSDPKVAHIESLVSKQKTAANRNTTKIIRGVRGLPLRAARKKICITSIPWRKKNMPKTLGAGDFRSRLLITQIQRWVDTNNRRHVTVKSTIISPLLNTVEVFLEPLINEHQLIGDDFFLQLAIKNFKAEARKPRVEAAIRCGLCISGQTIDECRQRLEKTQFLSGSIAILLGTVDIYRGHSLEKMVSDMKKLLDVCRNRFNLSQITLCTIPPLANYSVRFNLRKLAVLYSFNNWIKLHGNLSPDDSYLHHYNVVDLFSKFTDCNHRTRYEYFQIDARMVSGCAYPYILWNSKGRRTAISMLEK